MNESALLKCEKCGNTQRVWLEKCSECSNSKDNKLKDKIDELTKQLEIANKNYLAMVDVCNNYSCLLHELYTLSSYGSPKILLNKIHSRLNAYLEKSVAGK